MTREKGGDGVGRDISIAISAQDNYSEVLKKMQNANKTFGRSMDGLQEKLDALNQNKVSLNIDFEKARKELKQAQKESQNTREDIEKLGKAQANFDNVKQNLSAVNKAIRETQKEMGGMGSSFKQNMNGISETAQQAQRDIESTETSISRLDNRMATMQSGNNLLSRIGQAGVLQFGGSMVADVFSNSMGAYFNSALPGDEATVANSILGSTLSTAASGAAIGTMIAPGIGTAIGGALGGIGGAIAGWFNGETQVFENEDAAFKTFVQGQYEKVTQSASEELQSGISVAGKREQTGIAFSTLFKDKEQEEIRERVHSPDELAEYEENSFSKRFLSDMNEMASTTPYELDQLTSLSKTLVNAYGSDTGQIKDVLTTLGDTGSALGMSDADMQMMAQGIVRMKTTDKATQEYLNYFAERGVNVYQYLAEGEGKTVKEVMEQISKGKVSGTQAVQVILDYMQGDFGGSMEVQANSLEGLQSTLNDAQTNLQNAMGEGYSEIRKQGLHEQINWYDSDTGKELEEMNRGIGQWQAELDNAKEEAYRNAMKDLVEDNEDYKIAKENGDWGKVYELKAAAESKAYTDYMRTSGAQEMQDANNQLARQIQKDASVNDIFKEAGYNFGQTLGMGLKSTTDITASEYVWELKKSVYKMLSGTYFPELGPDFANSRLEQVKDKNTELEKQGKQPLVPDSTINLAQSKNDSGFAYGLNRVPYDNFPALLHEGERVLTAQEARQQNNTPVININLSGVTIREDADIQRIAKELMREYNKARMAMP